MANETITGLLYPLIRVAGDFANGSGADLLRSNIRKAVATKAASADGVYRGELPWRLDFGSQVDRMRHAAVGRLRSLEDDLIRVYVTDGVLRWEPRASVNAEGVQVVREGSGQKVSVEITFAEAQKAAEGDNTEQVIAERVEVSL